MPVDGHGHPPLLPFAQPTTGSARHSTAARSWHTEDQALMEHVQFDDVSVDYDVVGSGEHVALLHARPFVSWYEPLVAALPGYSVLRYRRTWPPDRSAFGLGDDADACARLLHHVGFDHPHVVGHSYGGCLALELARRQLVAVRSIALLEPATSGLLDPEEAIVGLAPLIELHRSRGPAVAAEQFLRFVLGNDARSLLDRFIPAAYDEAVNYAAQFFRVELPAMAHWSFGPGDASRVHRPILNVLGADSVARFVQSAEIIQTLFPHARRYVLPGAGHLLMAQNPAPIAERLETFWSSSGATVRGEN
jgi:pimeloyl-ACP methyl ester carboxylesterase